MPRRIARAYDLVNTDKVTEVDDGIFRVRSQYEADKAYIVNVNSGEPSCNCPDGERTINCKHRIAALLFSQKQAITIIKTTDGEADDYWRRCWLIAQGNSRPMVYEERDRRLFCNCGAHYEDCGHKQLVIQTVTKELKRITNECGSNEAKQLQNKLNGQLDSRNGNGNGDAKSPSQLDINDPFQECEQYDIDQIEGRSNGELVHKLSNGEYVISYKGIMTLAEKHNIEFTVSLHDDTNTVIAKAMNGGIDGKAATPCERVSGKPIYGLTETAIELAKRNAARQLLPYAELKAVEKKFQLESEFSVVICGEKPACWEKAYRNACDAFHDAFYSEAAGGKPQCDIVIHELVKNGKLRQASCFEYNRTEWLMIHNACQKEAQVNAVVSRESGLSPRRDPKSLNRWSYNSAEFLEQCREVINQVRESKKSIEANEMPLQTEVKRKLMMDKKLKTWLIESDGTKKPISCREICEKFESKEKDIITRLRAGIDSGADFSTVELN